MDKRLEQALEFANFQQTHYLEKRRLQEKLKSDLIFGYNGGTFNADRNFIVFLNLLIPKEGKSSVTILDDRLNPVYIEDIEDLQKQALAAYFTAVNQYQIEFEHLRKKRSVKALLDL
jgi:hypothetical protein